MATTFRLPISKVVSLKEESEKRRLTPNALLNQIMYDHVEFHALSRDAGFMPFQKKTLVRMVTQFDQAAINALSQAMARDFVDFVIMKEGEFSQKTFLGALVAWFNQSGFSHMELTEDGRITTIVHHDMGEKWSLFMIMFLRESLENLTDRKVFFEHSETVVAVTLS